ncbi:MYG1 family protein [Rubritalea marina]|uniref:MYG1 family protein n=1 Tax=Rubritalea marina TaxID=361055 RepID=UPI0003713095|nr:MYG1 family protein [Rubritalea marina]
MSLERIVTHPGGAHKDDFLACSLMIARYAVPVLRREPSADDLSDRSTAVVDVGGEHAPEQMNFDHHQFPANYAPTCALSLVLKHLRLYEEAREFCDWLETTEWIDTRGIVKTSQWLGVDRLTVAKLNSPVDITLLRRFAKEQEHHPGQPIYEVMRMIGEDMISYLEGMRTRMDEIANACEVWELGEGFKALFMPRVDADNGELSACMSRYIEKNQLGCAAMVYPDRRGEGYGLSRFNDDLRLDFTRVNDCEDVHFAHKAGFIAKTTALEVDRLKNILHTSWVG